jgi:SEC-C motif-containing protein
MDTCFCGNNESFENCCKPFILKDKLPETAEQLMRSRYSAYCVKNINYLYDTTDPVKRFLTSKSAIKKWANQAEWQGLEIVRSEFDLVEFKAFYKEVGSEKLNVHHEISRFRLENKQWYYVDGSEG